MSDYPTQTFPSPDVPATEVISTVGFRPAPAPPTQALPAPAQAVPVPQAAPASAEGEAARAPGRRGIPAGA